MSPPNEGGPRKGRPQEGPAIKPDVRSHLSVAADTPRQLPLFARAPGDDAFARAHARSPGPEPVQACAIPNHPLHPAEAHLRSFVNRLAFEGERPHWWLAALRAGRPCCSWCWRDAA